MFINKNLFIPKNPLLLFSLACNSFPALLAHEIHTAAPRDRRNHITGSTAQKGKLRSSKGRGLGEGPPADYSPFSKLLFHGWLEPHTWAMKSLTQRLPVLPPAQLCRPGVGANSSALRPPRALQGALAELCWLLIWIPAA